MYLIKHKQYLKFWNFITKMPLFHYLHHFPKFLSKWIGIAEQLKFISYVYDMTPIA